jgi:soluble lytic murein transglycosylase
LPQTAKESAQKVGLAYSKDRLTSDPGYNAILGAVHLGNLIGDYRGSYVLALAAYNAGTGQSRVGSSRTAIRVIQRWTS